MSLCIIAPRLPPALDGIGDYMSMLWRYIGEPSDWWFAVYDGAEDSRAIFQPAKVETLPRTADALKEFLQRNDTQKILIQYVGYGFSDKGGPNWLTSGLAEWRKANPDRRLYVMYHESWPRAKFWQRTYWTISHQIRCVRDLLEAADGAATSNPATQADLVQLGTNTQVEIIPIGTTFDVIPADTVDFKAMQIFGREAPRARALKWHGALLRKSIAEGRIRRLVFAGERNSQDIEWTAEPGTTCTVETAYNFDAKQVPAELFSCGLALMHTESTYLLKSTSFHLACSLGQVPITLEAGPAGPFAMRNKHYLSYEQGSEQQLLEQLNDIQLLKSIRDNVMELSKTELNWQSIADRWKQLISS